MRRVRNRTNLIKNEKRARTVHPQKNGIYRYIIANHSVRKTQKGGLIQTVKLGFCALNMLR